MMPPFWKIMAGEHREPDLSAAEQEMPLPVLLDPCPVLLFREPGQFCKCPDRGVHTLGIVHLRI